MGRERHNLRWLRERRRSLRTDATPAERRLRKALRRRQLDGWKWRRQYSVGPYIVDFFCPAARIAVELDGAVHRDPVRATYDARRQRWLEAQGIRVLRFENGAVAAQVQVVLDAIRWALEDQSPPPGLPPVGGGDAGSAD